MIEFGWRAAFQELEDKFGLDALSHYVVQFALSNLVACYQLKMTAIDLSIYFSAGSCLLQNYHSELIDATRRTGLGGVSEMFPESQTSPRGIG